MDALLNLAESALAEGLGDSVVANYDLLWISFCLDCNLLTIGPFLVFLVHSYADEFKFNESQNYINHTLIS